MADSDHSEHSSSVYPLDNLEAALMDLTGELLPGNVDQIHYTNPSDQETVMSQLVGTVLTTTVKDKEKSKTLGSMAVVMFAQLRHS